jgi:hypothetical protein
MVIWLRPYSLLYLIFENWSSSVTTVTMLWGGQSKFDFWQGRDFFVFATVSRPTLWPTQPPKQWVPGTPYPGIKHLGCEADHSPPSSAKVKNVWNYTFIPPFVFMAWYLVYLYLALSLKLCSPETLMIQLSSQYRVTVLHTVTNHEMSCWHFHYDLEKIIAKSARITDVYVQTLLN